MTPLEIGKEKLQEIRRRLLDKAIKHNKSPDWYRDMVDLCVLLEWSLRSLELQGAKTFAKQRTTGHLD